MALGYLAFIPESGTVRYSLAGQPPPLIRRAAGPIEELRMPDHRVPLGALRFGGHKVLSASLGADDLLLAYSDGVIDAVSPEGESFGHERLLRVLGECPGDPTQAINWVIEALEDFTRGHTPYDDVTLVAARRSG